VTVSVSTVMVLGGSVDGFGLVPVKLVKDRRARSDAAREALGARGLFPPSGFTTTVLEEPSSQLPSPSFAAGSVFFFWSRFCSSILGQSGDPRTGPIDGVVGTLLSATVSSGLAPVLGPRPGTRKVDLGMPAS
jgi:hypothetical protein